MDTPFESSEGRGGFSLVELMVAVVILSVGVLGTVTLLVGVTRNEMRTTSRVEMTELAEGKIDQLRAAASVGAPYPLELSVGGSQTTSQANHADTVSSPAGRVYVRRWEIEAGPAGTITLHMSLDVRDQVVFPVPAVVLTTNMLLR